MQIAIIGAGPAGLYAAILLKKLRPDAEITVVEQNSADATFGFGVVFSDQALAFLRDDDAQTADLIEPHMKRWSDIAVIHREERIAIDGVGFSGIGRLHLLKLLQSRAQALDIALTYQTRLEDLSVFDNFDLVIGADGLNSIVRTSDDFGEEVTCLRNYFVWYGADREFDALTQTFIDTPYGPMNAHHYSYMAGQSTFIIEMGPETFQKTGFAHMSEPEYRRHCEALFSQTLEDAHLTPNNSIWRQFPNLSCARWHVGNKVLIGDALHTAHFSIGSGTRLALEDVIALARALKETDFNVALALPAYQATRQPVLEKITKAAKRSAQWYENFEEHMKLEPWEFALSYIRRAGRLDSERLRGLAPRFTASLEAKGINLELAA